MKRLRSKKGFTLIELIVVIAILAILAAILIPAILGYIETANQRRDQTNSRSLYSEALLKVATATNDSLNGTTVGATGIVCTISTSSGAVTAFTCDTSTGTWSSANNFATPVVTP